MKTLIIDNYDSFTFNLYQMTGELGGNPRVVRNDALTVSDVKMAKYSHIILSPGPGSPLDANYFGICRQVILTCGIHVPLLGVCLGHQGIISAFGGNIVKAPKVRHGKTSNISHDQKGIFADIPNPFIGMRYHSLVGDKNNFPNELTVQAVAEDDNQIMAVAHNKYPIYGFQFHPESIATPQGSLLLQNFLRI